MSKEVRDEIVNVIDGVGKVVSGVTKLVITGVSSIFDTIEERKKNKELIKKE